MKLKLIVLLVAVLFALTACIGPVPIATIDEQMNEAPAITAWAYQSPNGVEQHQPFEWDVRGNGYDLDGEIVLWVIRINGETFRVGNDPERLEKSEVIRYQFPGSGWYSLSVTAFDDDGASATYTPPPSGLWHVEH